MDSTKKTARKFVGTAVFAAALIIANGGFAAINKVSTPSVPDAWSYADVADLMAGAPIVLRAKIVTATRLKASPDQTGAFRFYVEAAVVALIRAPQAVPPKLAWLVDVAPDSRGKIPKLVKSDVLVAALPVAGRPGELRLAARDAQAVWSPALESRVRNIVASVAASDAPPAVTGIASAFHTAGTVTGEGETQIFLSTVTKAPISISVLTRPGQPKRWAFALGEIVDESAAPPVADTLAWYRLACFLPRTLPDIIVGDLTAPDAAAVRDDYDFVMRSLGTCARRRR